MKNPKNFLIIIVSARQKAQGTPVSRDIFTARISLHTGQIDLSNVEAVQSSQNLKEKAENTEK